MKDWNEIALAEEAAENDGVEPNDLSSDEMCAYFERGIAEWRERQFVAAADRVRKANTAVAAVMSEPLVKGAR